jgi:Uma2 family endonuclease
MTAPAVTPSRPDDPLAFEGSGHYEFVDGQLQERNVSTNSSRVAVAATLKLGTVVEAAGLGVIFDSELGIRIWPDDPERTRRADLSFLRLDRAPAEDSGYLYVAPDLVVEVVSPGDNAASVRDKVTDWLAGGVRMVWVIFPSVREVYVYRADAHPQILTAEETLSGYDVVPGFSCPVASLFPASLAAPR